MIARTTQGARRDGIPALRTVSRPRCIVFSRVETRGATISALASGDWNMRRATGESEILRRMFRREIEVVMASGQVPPDRAAELRDGLNQLRIDV